MKDIFEEDKITPIKGLLRRYKDRVLIEITMKCPHECAFCFRKWKKEERQDDLTTVDIDNIFNFLVEEKDIKQVIFSGGDPLFRSELLEYAMRKLGQIGHIKIFRIHTRLPITAPEMVTKRWISFLTSWEKQLVYMSLHVNSRSEINREVEKIVNEIRKTGVILYSQSVFLRDINDSVKELEKLFEKLVEMGVRPYNIYHCNEIGGLEKFVVPLEEEAQIMTDLRKKVSGFCCPTLIVDAPISANKIPVPTSFWKFGLKNFCDFEGNLVKVTKS